MALSRLGGGSGGVPPIVQGPTLESLLGGQGNNINSMVGLINALQNLQNAPLRQELLQQRQELSALRLQRALEQAEYGSNKVLDEVKANRRIQNVGMNLINNPDFITDVRNLQGSSVKKREQGYSDIKERWFKPIGKQYAVDPNELYKQVLNPYLIQLANDKRNVDENKWGAVADNLKIGYNNLAGSIKSVFDPRKKEEVVREYEAENQKIIEQNAYLKDQAKRANEGESLWQRTEGVAGLSNLLAGQAPTIAAFMLPGSFVANLARFVGTRLGAAALSNPVVLQTLSGWVNRISGGLLGTALADTSYVSSAINNPNMTEAQQQEALHNSPLARGANAVLGGVLGAIAPNPMGAVRSATTRLSSAYRAAAPAERQFMLNVQPTIDASRRSLLGNVRYNGLNTAVGLGGMAGGQTLASNMLLNNAVGQQVVDPMQGVWENTWTSALTGGLLGAAAGARTRLPVLNDLGLPRQEQSFHINRYNIAPNEAARQEAVRGLGIDYPQNDKVLNNFIKKNNIHDPVEVYKITQWYNNQPVDSAAITKIINNSAVTNPIAKNLVASTPDVNAKVYDLNDIRANNLAVYDVGKGMDARLDPANANVTPDAKYFVKDDGSNPPNTAKTIKVTRDFIKLDVDKLVNDGYSKESVLQSINDHFKNLLADPQLTATEKKRLNTQQYIAEALLIQEQHKNLRPFFEKLGKVKTVAAVDKIMNENFKAADLNNLSTTELNNLKHVLSKGALLGSHNIDVINQYLDWIKNNIDPVLQKRPPVNNTTLLMQDTQTTLTNPNSTPQDFRNLLAKYPVLDNLVNAHALANNITLNDATIKTAVNDTFNRFNTSFTDMQNNVAQLDPNDPITAYVTQYATNVTPNSADEAANTALNNIVNNINTTGRLIGVDKVAFDAMINGIYKPEYEQLRSFYDTMNNAGDFELLSDKEKAMRLNAFMNKSRTLTDLSDPNVELCQ